MQYSLFLFYSLAAQSLSSETHGESKSIYLNQLKKKYSCLSFTDRYDETPVSTIKFGSETLEEQQEKDEFYQVKFIFL